MSKETKTETGMGYKKAVDRSSSILKAVAQKEEIFADALADGLVSIPKGLTLLNPAGFKKKMKGRIRLATFSFGETDLIIVHGEHNSGRTVSGVLFWAVIDKQRNIYKHSNLTNCKDDFALVNTGVCWFPKKFGSKIVFITQADPVKSLYTLNSIDLNGKWEWIGLPNSLMKEVRREGISILSSIDEEKARLYLGGDPELKKEPGSWKICLEEGERGFSHQDSEFFTPLVNNNYYMYYKNGNVYLAFS